MASPAIATASTARLAQAWESRPGLYGRLATVDHKIIGKRYLLASFLFLILGGLEAAAMRAQLSGPDKHLLTPEQYNQLFTMHGVTMIFLYAAPVLAGFSNYLWPLLLGTRDMALPRLNALSFWLFLFSGLFIYTSVALGQVPDTGWFSYAPLTEQAASPTLGPDFYALGLIFLGISTTAGAINFAVTFFTARATGMSLNRVPILLWGSLTTAVMSIFAIPALTVACAFLFLDRRLGMHFFDAAAGGHPLLWQHLFWIFGHPWVYIIVLPAMGMVSDILPVFCRRPLAGYTYVALATVSTGILGFGVWVHHMFATGLPPLALSFFSAASMVIAIPSAISVAAWTATIWHGRVVVKTPFLFMAGFVVLFVIGGVSGVMTASVPFDQQLTDTYFIVAHLHYVLIGINVFPVIAAIYFWLPKMSGRMMNERLGRWNFWLMFVAFNVGFFPMHIAGLLGMPRRIYTYSAGLGWDTVNLISTIGAYGFAAGILLFFVNVLWSLRRGPLAGPNPWDGATLEWSVPSPPPDYNFATLPVIESRHPLWERRLAPDLPQFSDLTGGSVLDQGRQTLQTTPIDAEPGVVLRMAADSIWPLVLGLALLASFFGLLFSSPAWLGVGAAFLIVAINGWLWPEHAPQVSE